MDKQYLECLENIIQIEKNCLTQERLITALTNKISSLAIPKNLKAPSKTETYVPPVEYDLVYEGFDTDHIGATATACGLIFGISRLLYSLSTSSSFIVGIFDGVVNGAVFLGIGLAVGAIIGSIVSLAKMTQAKRTNQKAQQNAQAEANRLWDRQQQEDEKRYKNELKRYQTLVKFEKSRIIDEEKKKRELFFLREEVIKKHTETKQVRDRLYDFADIYSTYRNIIAVCHIYEYLKSGICRELTGHEGAYLVFKYEMYEKLKIEKLDTIISKLDQLHFDNITLNNTMKQIGSQVDTLISEVSNLRISTERAAEKQEQLIGSLGDKIDFAREQNSRENAILAYNQECAIFEARVDRILR